MNATINSIDGVSKTDSAINETGLDVSVQFALEELDFEGPPSSEAIVSWAQTAFAKHRSSAGFRSSRKNTLLVETVIRIVDEREMTELNNSFRGKSKPTNVLSFPAELPQAMAEDLNVDLLGDIVICHGVVVAEAIAQHKTINGHYAHMVTHGVLHLCGYDHEDEINANVMEALEVDILASVGIENPYK